MKGQSRKLIAFILLLFVSFVGFSQQQTTTNKKIDIVTVYEQTIKEGYPTLEIYQKLATTQYFRSNYKEAKKWFEMWFEMEPPKDETSRYRYRQTLRALNVETKKNKYLAVSKSPQ
tara:strand:- start:1290 stop:1637 length:348 start_codon:yes stop_codon:yes gene_type:complete